MTVTKNDFSHHEFEAIAAVAYAAFAANSAGTSAGGAVEAVMSAGEMSVDVDEIEVKLSNYLGVRKTSAIDAELDL